VLFGSALIRARHEAQLTQTELARLSHLSPGHISRLEANQKPPTLNTLRKLSMVLTFPTLTLADLLASHGTRNGHVGGT
jgi:transcriptional regulator with XRE-family HTH domain